MAIPLKSLSIEEIEEVVTGAGLPKFRASQLLEWVYSRGVRTYDEMTNLPKTLREQFSQVHPLYTSEITVKQVSVDGSRKYLIELHDGTRVEAVGLPSQDGRLTVCASSQAGCAMNCAFCATGRAGLTRDLEPGEIVDQILIIQDDFGQRVTNVVIMGQGEPFANYDNTLAALRIMNHPKLLNIGARHITVSTCGIIPRIEQFTREPEQFTLAVSLHAARQEVRDLLMPAVANQRLGALRKALDEYATSTGRRFTLEYALMEGVNDTEQDLEALVQFARRLLCHVNLIPLNDVEGSEFHPVSQQLMQDWQYHLESQGIPATVRRSRGSDIAAACGQLANRG